MFKLSLLAMIFASLMFSGCASQKLANSDELQSKALADAANIDATPDELIRRASERLNNAAQELRFYSPLHMQKAQEQLEQARQLHQAKDPENQTAVMAAAILAEKLVKQAEDNREQVKQQLAPALAHRDILIELGSPELVPDDYNGAMSDLNKLIQSVESGQLDYVAKNQPELLADFIEVEASTLKVKWLNRAKAKLEQAEDADADKYAPKSFEQAELAIERADTYTDTNYRDRTGVKAKADEAYVLAAKALNLSNEVQKVYETKISELESYLLDVQAWLDHINQDVKVPDLPALTFYEQSRAIAAKIFEQKHSQAKAVEQHDRKEEVVVDSKDKVVVDGKENVVVDEPVEAFPVNEAQALPEDAVLNISQIDDSTDAETAGEIADADEAVKESESEALVEDETTAEQPSVMPAEGESMEAAESETATTSEEAAGAEPADPQDSSAPSEL